MRRDFTSDRAPCMHPAVRPTASAPRAPLALVAPHICPRCDGDSARPIAAGGCVCGGIAALADLLRIDDPAARRAKLRELVDGLRAAKGVR